MSGYLAHPKTWVGSGRGMLDSGDTLGTVVDALCYGLMGTGDCWGQDDIGRAFFNGDEKTPGYGASRTQVLDALADMVNLLRATGGMLIVSGHTYALAEEASTVGSALPPGADKGALAETRPYTLPPETKAFPQSDPEPSSLSQMAAFLETLVGGCPWPDGSLGYMSGLAREWRIAAYQVRLVAEDVTGHARAVTANNAGEATQQFASYADALQGGGEEGGLVWLAEACEGLAGSVDNLIAQKKAARLQWTLTLDFLVATWAIAMAWSAFTAGGSVESATLVSRAAGLTLKQFLRNVAKAVLMGAWYAGGMDAAGQYARIHYGLQDGFDGGEFLKAVGEGAIAGAVMGGAGSWVAKRGNRLTTALANLMGADGFKGGAARFLFSGTTGTAGNLAGQEAVEHHMDVGQAAAFGFGMAALDAGKHGVASAALSGKRGSTGTGGDEVVEGEIVPDEPTPPPAGAPPRAHEFHSETGEGYDHEGEVVSDSGWQLEPGPSSSEPARLTTGPTGPVPHTELARAPEPPASPSTGRTPPGHGVGTVHPDTPTPKPSAPVVPHAGDVLVAGPHPENSASAGSSSNGGSENRIADVLNRPVRRGGQAVTPEQPPPHEQGTAAPAQPLQPGEGASPAGSAGGTHGTSGDRPEVIWPDYAKDGVAGDGMDVRTAELPADPLAAARRWGKGFAPDLDPRVRDAIERHLADVLADGSPDRLLDLLKNGETFTVRGKDGKHAVTLWLNPRDPVHLQGTGGARKYSVEFGSWEAAVREGRSNEKDASIGAAHNEEISDMTDDNALPGVARSKTSSETHARVTRVMPGHKVMVAAHDAFDVRGSVEVYLDGAKVANDARVPDLSMTIAYPENFRGENPADGTLPPLPRHAVPDDRAGAVRPYRPILTAVDNRPIVAKLVSHAIAKGMRPEAAKELANRLAAGPLGQQQLANQGAALLDGFSVGGVEVRAKVVRMEHLARTHGTIRDDLATSTIHRDGERSKAKWQAAGRIKISWFFDPSGRTLKWSLGGHYQKGHIHVTMNTDTSMVKLTALQKQVPLDVYRARLEVEIKSKDLGTFTTEAPSWLTVRAEDAAQMERDIWGAEKTDGLLPPPPSAHSAAPALAHHGPARIPEEPPALAAGRGTGRATLHELPGAERIVPQIRETVTGAVPGLTDADSSRLAELLAPSFGQRGLEGRTVADLVNGVDFSAVVKGHRVDVSLTANLGDVVSRSTSDVTVNTRDLTMSGVVVGHGKVFGVGADTVGAVELKLDGVADMPGSPRLRRLLAPLKWVKVSPAKLTGSVGLDRTRGDELVKNMTTYSRRETSGPTITIKKSVSYTARVRVHGPDGSPMTDVSWNIHGKDMTANVLVPEVHVPRGANADVADIGRLERTTDFPENSLDLSGQVTGITPTIAAIRGLDLEVARTLADLNGHEAPHDRLDVPLRIRDATQPSRLQTDFGRYTAPGGLKIPVGETADGWQQAVRIELRVGAPRDQFPVRGIESEHYRTTGYEGVATTEGGWHLAGQARLLGVHVHAGDVEGLHEVGLTRGIGRNTSVTAAEGSTGVLRGTYSDEGVSHIIDRADLHIKVTPVRWKGHTVEEGTPVHLRAHESVDLTVPDRMAQRHALAGPPTAVVPATEPRTYLPEAAMPSAFPEVVEAPHLLDRIVGALEDAGTLFEGERLTASQNMRILEKRFAPEALAADLPTLVDHGVTQVFHTPIGDGHTRVTRVSVRAELNEGRHTGDRPELRQMIRTQPEDATSTTSKATSSRGFKWRVRGIVGYHDVGIGGQHTYGRSSQTETGHSARESRRRYDRRQTLEGSQEFTHDVDFEVSIQSVDLPAKVAESLVDTARNASGWVAARTGNRTAAAFGDHRQNVRTHTEHTSGRIVVAVSNHLTRPATAGEPVPGWRPVAGEAHRWARYTPPLAHQATLLEPGLLHRIALPGAPAIREMAAMAAVPKKLRGPVPQLSEPLRGPELNRYLDADLDERFSERNLLAHVDQLLAHEFTVEGGDHRPGEKIRLGINISSLVKVTDATYKIRMYQQDTTLHKDTQAQGRSTSHQTGVSGGPEVLTGLGSRGGERGTTFSNDAGATDIRERDEEAVSPTNLFAANVTGVAHLPDGTDLLVDIPRGFYLALTEADLAFLRSRHPSFTIVA
ncbi:hypothetical protein [Actinoallomurus sp. CA-142502]|uniref:WXG100-like domain-containing protein n=1 Tax=Actinoallomurus sp. CA-142502 TaxID=3239885 RepID=UPI003D94EC96